MFVFYGHPVYSIFVKAAQMDADGEAVLAPILYRSCNGAVASFDSEVSLLTRVLLARGRLKTVVTGPVIDSLCISLYA